MGSSNLPDTQNLRTMDPHLTLSQDGTPANVAETALFSR